MAGNTKALRIRIKSVKSTEQITKAMELVASSKIRRATEAMMKAREYTSVLENSMALLMSDSESLKSPYMRKGGEERTRIVVVAGDRGLAGGYNANVFRLAATFPDAQFISVGKRSCEKYGNDINSSERYSFEDAYALAEELCRDFAEGEFDRLGIISTRYVSVMTQTAEIRWILPLERKEDSEAHDIIFEPDHITVLNNAVREYVAGIITSCIRESFACEVAARRMAMNSAGKNAKQMIDDLQLEYNRARQGAITQEITEIVAGSGN